MKRLKIGLQETASWVHRSDSELSKILYLLETVN